MKKALTTATLVCLAVIAAMAQPRGGPQEQQPVRPPQPVQPPANAQPAQANINLIIEQLQKAVLSTNAHLGKLRIDKWKTDSAQKQQFQRMADSIQRNVTDAVPGLINDVETSHGSVSSTFKLYHNMTIVYEYLSSLTDAAGALGKREEYEPLAQDAEALDTARQNLSTYIEQTASQIESRRRAPAVPPSPTPVEANDQKLPEGVHIVTEKNGVRRIVVDSEHKRKPVRSTKKKTSKSSKASRTAKPSPSPTPSPTPK
ncbi:MAG TPA: hypothetical protein VFP59_04655 [Candidatus Angelobacter sp.]|nr:hypothetical protein [Candidatus Angelobacter sp.]